MMLGMIAQRAAPQASGAILALADFVNGVYSVGETSLTAADVVDDTGRISGSGLSITTTEVELLGAFAALLLEANWTVVVEFTAGTPAGSGHRLLLCYLIEAADSDEATIYTQNLFAYMFDTNASETPSSREANDFDNQGVVGTNRIAATRTDAGIAVSLNGEPAFTDNNAMAAAGYDGVFCASHTDTGTAGHIRRIEVYAPVLSAALSALSAV